MKCFVTGCAGFIGSNLVDSLLAEGHQVVGIDNLSTGRREFMAEALRSERFRFHQGDVLDYEYLVKCMREVDFVYHLSANADVRFGTAHPRKDLEQNTIGTANILEAMRETGVKRLAFSSTGSVYGEPETFPTPENAPFPVQTSLYGASKLAAEGMIAAYCEGFDFQAYIFRFVSFLGERYTHGHVFDFYKRLRANPHQLEVLGDGTQTKSYLYVKDGCRAILSAVARATGKVNIFNLGTNEHCRVTDSIRWISEYLGVKPEIIYGGGKRGWVGDSPFIFLDCTRIRELGWAPTVSIQEGIIRTLRYLVENPWVLERSPSS
jgi:UDP-glucose 4-epimerase